MSVSIRLILVTVLMASWGLVADADAAPILDQDNSGPASTTAEISSAIDRAQIFTVGITGDLTSVSVEVYNASGATADLTVWIQTVSGGFPTGVTLSSLAVPAASLPAAAGTLVNFDIPDVVVISGDHLAIGIQGENDWMVSETSGNAYAAGQEVVRNAGGGWETIGMGDLDLRFQTFVDPLPVPVEEASWGGIKATFE